MIEVIFLSDGKASNTDIPSRLFKAISLKKDIRINFFTLSFFSIIKIYAKFFDHILKKKKLIINTHHFKSAFFICFIKNIFLVSDIKNIKWVHTFHCEIHRFKGVKRLINFIIYRKSDLLIGVSKGVSNGWKVFLKKKKIITILNGISKYDYRSINKRNIDIKAKKRLLWVGRFEKIKNPLMFIDALSALKSKEPIDVVIVGDGSLKKQLTKKLISFNKTKQNNSVNIKILPKLSRYEVLMEFKKANIYVNTSKSEAFCTSALEALVNKFCFLVIPKIESLTSTYRYKNVFFYDKDSPEDLASHLDKLICKDLVTTKLTNYENFPEKFKLNYCANRYIKVYKNTFKKNLKF